MATHRVTNFLIVLIVVLAALYCVVLTIQLYDRDRALGAAKDSMAAASTEAARLREDFGALSAQGAESERQLALAQGQIAEISEDARNARSEADRFRARAACAQAPQEIDFASNRTVSKSLVDWIAASEKVKILASWELIWSQSKASVHKITGKNHWVFVVYFEDGKYGFSNAVINLRQQCFFDLH